MHMISFRMPASNGEHHHTLPTQLSYSSPWPLPPDLARVPALHRMESDLLRLSVVILIRPFVSPRRKVHSGWS